MTKSDLAQIIGFLEDNEEEFTAYLLTGAGGSHVTKEQAENEANSIIQRLQDFHTDSLWADYLTEQGDD